MTNIAFICGLTTPYTKSLCTQLAKIEETESPIEKITKMKNSGEWDIAFTYYFGDGSN